MKLSRLVPDQVVNEFGEIKFGLYKATDKKELTAKKGKKKIAGSKKSGTRNVRSWKSVEKLEGRIEMKSFICFTEMEKKFEFACRINFCFFSE